MLQTATTTRSIYLSKTDYINFRSCPGFSWMTKHQPHLVPEETDPGVIRRTNSGNDVELVARRLFPDGVLIDTEDLAEAVELTNEAIAAGASTLFQATVWTDRGLLARADMLTRRGDCWILGEVKATTSIKPEHVADATFQTIAFTDAGFDIAEVQLIHLEKSYRRSGEPHPAAVLVSDTITARVQSNLERVEHDITQALSTIQDPDQPGICLCDMGTRGQRCPTFAHFHPNVPRGNTIYDLGSVSATDLGHVLARGVVNLADWPDDVRISARQRQQINALRTGETHVDRKQLGGFLAKLEYPLHFLDYETFQTAVPMFDLCGPWSQVPFQYSLHIVAADGAVRHCEFLWTERHAFPVPTFLDQLQRDLEPRGTVIVWNQGFEKTRNKEMAEMIPAAAGFLFDLNARMVDLMDIVKKGLWVHPDFNGSASIKKVLPVVAPDLSYDMIEIGNGSLASERWFEAVMGDAQDMADDERAAVFDALREYCHLDTLAMVRILGHVQDLAGAHIAPR